LTPTDLSGTTNLSTRRLMSAPGSGGSIVMAQTITLIGAETGFAAAT
jgi:hypothetical protein